MSWFCPSYGRPDSLRRMVQSPGGMPSRVVLLLNDDDPTLPQYRDALPPGWEIALWPAGSRVGDIWRDLFERFPDEPFYGAICDDNEPETPGWHEILVLAAADRYAAIANGDASYPKIRNAVCFGPELARAMGSLVPPGFRHNYLDDALDLLFADLGLLRPCDGVIVRHRHPLLDPTVASDATYERGSHDIAEDAEVWREFLIRGGRQERTRRVAGRLGMAPPIEGKPRLCIATPAHDGKVALEYVQSLAHTMTHMAAKGITVDLVMVPGEALLAKARNTVLELFLRNRASHLLFIDADMGWHPAAPYELLRHGTDPVAAAGRRKIDRPEFCVQLAADRIETDATGCFKAVRVGTGFMMLSRACALRMVDAYPETLYRDWQSGDWLNALFDTQIRDGQFWGEDFTFCDRWTAIGGEVWVDPGINLQHVGSRVYSGALADTFTPVAPLFQEAAE